MVAPPVARGKPGCCLEAPFISHVMHGHKMPNAKKSEKSFVDNGGKYRDPSHLLMAALKRD